MYLGLVRNYLREGLYLYQISQCYTEILITKFHANFIGNVGTYTRVSEKDRVDFTAPSNADVMSQSL